LLEDSLDPEGAKKRTIREKQAKLASGPCPPEEMFRTGSWAGKFQAFDEHGFPQTDKDGKTISKSQRKKLIKLHTAQKKKWEKFTASGKNKKTSRTIGESDKKDQGTERTVSDSTATRKGGSNAIENGVVKVVHGTFGNRQGFKSEAELGPFSHILDF